MVGQAGWCSKVWVLKGLEATRLSAQAFCCRTPIHTSFHSPELCLILIEITLI